MTLLELITEASANTEPRSKLSKYPITLNPDEIFFKLKPESEDSDASSLVRRLTGWEISEIDSEHMESTRAFYKKLSRSLKDTRNFSQGDFAKLLNSFLEMRGKQLGVTVGVDKSDGFHTMKLIEKLGSFMGSDVSRLVTDACVALELWELLDCLIVNGLVQHSQCSSLVSSLVEKRRSDLLCSCIKHFKDLQTPDILCILKYFLSLPHDGYASALIVQREWQSQGTLAIEKASDGSLVGVSLRVAREAAILLMIANDEFSVSELCLHYLLSSLNMDEVVLSSAISKLNGAEMMGLISYLGKWLKKYERFPQACPCPDAHFLLGLKACDWVPKVEDAANCLGLVVDEHFSSLVLHHEFHEELGSIGVAVDALAFEAKLCCSIANVLDYLRSEVKAV